MARPPLLLWGHRVMGHQLPQSLPATRSHREVVGLLGDGAGMAGLAGVIPGSLDQVADAMLEASLDGLERAKRDDGLIYSFYLLTQITHAARLGDDFSLRLRELGVAPPPMAFHPTPGGDAGVADTIYTLVANFTNAVDQRLTDRSTRSDLGEIAIRAAAESLTTLCEDNASTLFGSSQESVQDALYKLSTKNGFAKLSQDFFARMTRGFLIYNLSKELSNHVGPGRRFGDISEHNDFIRGLDQHCRTASSVLEAFSGQWYSKHKFQGGITERKTFGWVSHALDKMRSALRYSGGPDAA